MRSAALALSLAACAPTDAPLPGWFEERAARSGLGFEHDTGHVEGRYRMPESIAGGAALLDADGDGRLDAYLVQAGERAANRLFLQRGELRFEDATEGSGAGDRGYGMGATAGDVDGDGDADLVVTNLGPNALLLARGDGRFDDATERWSAGTAGWSTSAALADLDRDGDLDLYVANYLAWSEASERECRNARGARDYCTPRNYGAPAADALLANEDGRGFRDASAESGVGAVRRTGLGVGCADFDGDGWLEVFVANDAMADCLWRTAGGLAFTDEALAAGCAVDASGLEKAGMGVGIADVDGDGDEDLLVGNIEGESDSFFRNGGGLLIDRTNAIGLARVSRGSTRFGLGWFDFDCDGRLDLFEANGRVNRQERSYADDPYAEPDLLLAGGADGRLEPVLLDAPVATSRAAAFGDLDDDGGIDIVIVNKDGPATLLANVAERGNWIGFRVLDEAGADALHARVTITVGGVERVAVSRSAASYLASNDPRVHFGLGEAQEVSEVAVRWADGEERRFGQLEAGRYHELRR